MENKYYTPDISEFHVGFEYERMNGTDWEKAELTNVDCWGTMARGYENEFEEIDSLIRSVRVKCLDKEDIESLGFKQLKSPIWFHVENVSLFNSGVCDLRISIWPREDNIRITISYPGVDDEQIFVGKCKNKSELKQILKMIGYDYNN